MILSLTRWALRPFAVVETALDKEIVLAKPAICLRPEEAYLSGLAYFLCDSIVVGFLRESVEISLPRVLESVNGSLLGSFEGLDFTWRIIQIPFGAVDSAIARAEEVDGVGIAIWNEVLPRCDSSQPVQQCPAWKLWVTVRLADGSSEPNDGRLEFGGNVVRVEYQQADGGIFKDSLTVGIAGGNNT